MGSNAREVGVSGQGPNGPETKCKTSAFHKYQVEHEHRERPAQEIQAFRCSPWVGWETMIAGLPPLAKGLVAQNRSAKAPCSKSTELSMDIIRSLERKYRQPDAVRSWLDQKACVRNGFPGPRAELPKIKRESSVCHCPHMGYDHHVNPAKEIQTFLCDVVHSWLGGK